MRRRIYEIIEKSNGEDKASSIYDASMIVIIVLSLLPLAFKEETSILRIIDQITVAIFIIDYLLRWITADYKFEKKGIVSFVRYPFSVMAIIDLISILPSLSIINSGFKVLRVLRMIRALRVIRVFKALRYSKNLEIIANVLKKSKNSLIAVCVLAGGYILVSALIVFNVEPDSFESFFDAVYWATVSLTTVGYGDIYPVSTLGRVITMVSSIFGVAIIALPAGIITAGYMQEIERIDSEKNEESDLLSKGA
ncbi:MAG: ion transporter [Firmicutes bacterium]|nr:ion transporter [Bacillota bacterium]